ncbi:hypothetical protein ACFRMN_18040 [Streptomyces sp. NPDC056835]|uniref:hypothetical protein n=1 Tax=Streptomyces sp. NPDC056835 TaxID=3345956 RepID=UPI0036B0D9B1
MICPFCDQNLLLKERPNRTCSHCKRRFALDPKTNSLRMSDLRVRRLLVKLTDGGRLKISVDQLGSPALPRTGPVKGESPVVEALGCLWVPLLVGIVMIIVGLSAEDMGGFAIAGSVLVLIAVLGLSAALIFGGKEQKREQARHPLSGFRGMMATDWKNVYGSLPPGVVDDFPYRKVYLPEGARIALLCPDGAIAAFLVANGIPERYGVAVTAHADRLPEEMPVVVLHDASAPGCRLVIRTREALPGRTVIDAGLPPRAVMRTPGAPARRGYKPAKDLIEWLGESGTLTKAELDWLAKGWTVSLVAIRPAKLLAAVSKTVERLAAATRTEPERREAEAVGFLTWPGEAGR